MIGFLRDRIDAYLGRGAHSTSVPIMDGPLQPNQRLEQARVLLACEGVDNLVSDATDMLFSAGGTLFRLESGKDGAESVETFGADITALAVSSQRARAIAVEGHGIMISGGPHAGRKIDTLGARNSNCITAMLFADEGTLIVAQSSTVHAAAQWKHDLMTTGSSGSVWRIRLADGAAECLAEGLRWPNGLAPGPAGTLLVAEAWAHRIVAVGTDKRPAVVLGDVPGYPGRLVKAAAGGYFLSVFAPRNPLFELVLREPAYRRRMVAQVPPSLWLAPALASGTDPREPLQLGGVKQMGTLKPWAPARSYGLVIRLDGDLQPSGSFHSRADGKMHGVTSLCEWNGTLVVGAKGAGKLLALDDSAYAEEA